MGITIDEAIKEINWSSKVHKKILETDAKELDVDSAWIKHWKSIVEAFDIAIDTMRKYQKIQKIINTWHHDIEAKDFECMAEIADVVEDEE